MKKNFRILVMFFLTIVVLTSCQGRKMKEQSKTEGSKTELQIAQDLKIELTRTFEDYLASRDVYKGGLESWEQKKWAGKPTWQLPLNLAGKTQTLDQKYYILGIYMANALSQRFYYGMHDEEQDKVIGKLAIETNLQALTDMNWETAKDVTWKELNDKNIKGQLSDFKAALENNSADKYIQLITAIYSECKYEWGQFLETTGENLEFTPVLKAMDAKATKCLIELIDKLLPYYPALKSTEPLVNDLRATQQAATEDEFKASYLKLFTNIAERRATFVAGLQ